LSKLISKAILKFETEPAIAIDANYTFSAVTRVNVAEVKLIPKSTMHRM